MKQFGNHPCRESFAFQKLKKQNVVEYVMDQMKELIVSKHLNVGDKIPSELELAEIFGISIGIIVYETEQTFGRTLIILYKIL